MQEFPTLPDGTREHIPIFVQRGIDDAQRNARLLLHGLQDGRRRLGGQEAVHARGERGAEGQDAAIVVRAAVGDGGGGGGWVMNGIRGGMQRHLVGFGRLRPCVSQC